MAQEAVLVVEESTSEQDTLPRDFPLMLDSPTDRVVGGQQVSRGEWEDTVGIVFYGQYVGCTGTLVAPDLVMTAGHCVGGITDVVIGTTDWANDEAEEIIAVQTTYEYPRSQSSLDAAILVLSEKSTKTPRIVAQGCILDDYLYDGVDVTVVGFGGTQSDGGGYNTEKHVGITQVQTYDCTKNDLDGIWTGCNPSEAPGGEIGAGGNQVDACFGDSGGPLYLPTPEGTYLIGITSRAYAGVPWNEPCLYGGIYVRADAIIDWVEEVTGTRLAYPPCNKSPEPEVEELKVPRGGTGSTSVTINDPDGRAAWLQLAEAPGNGSVAFLDNGVIEYTADKGFKGMDEFTISVTDEGIADYPEAPQNVVNVTVPVQVGCLTTGLGGSWCVLLLAAASLRRRNAETP
jgi:hypothetical protein